MQILDEKYAILGKIRYYALTSELADRRIQTTLIPNEIKIIQQP